MTSETATSDHSSGFGRYRQSGAVDLRNDLVEKHLALARGLARRYSRRGLAFDDLEQVARLALIQSVERFDPELGVRFETFASRSIDGTLKRYFRDKAWAVRVPRQYQEIGGSLRLAMDCLSAQLKRAPTVQELAGYLGLGVDDVVAAMEAARAYNASSLDQTVSPDGATLADRVGSTDKRQDEFEDQDQVASLLKRLPSRQRTIVELRFLQDRSQREIAGELGISQMHVSRLLRRALSTMRTDQP